MSLPNTIFLSRNAYETKRTVARQKSRATRISTAVPNEAISLNEWMEEAIRNNWVRLQVPGLTNIFEELKIGNTNIDGHGNSLNLLNLGDLNFDAAGGGLFRFGSALTIQSPLITLRGGVNINGNYNLIDTRPPGGDQVMGWRDGKPIWLDRKAVGSPKVDSMSLYGNPTTDPDHTGESIALGPNLIIDSNKVLRLTTVDLDLLMNMNPAVQSTAGQVLGFDGTHWVPVNRSPLTLQEQLNLGDALIDGQGHDLEFSNTDVLDLIANTNIRITAPILTIGYRGGSYNMPVTGPNAAGTEVIVWQNGRPSWVDGGSLFNPGIPYLLSVGDTHVDHHGNFLQFDGTDQFRVETDDEIYMESTTDMKLYSHGGYKFGIPGTDYDIPANPPSPAANQIMYWRKTPNGTGRSTVEWFDPETFGALPIVQNEAMIPPATVATPQGARYYVLQTNTGQPYNMMYIYDDTSKQYNPVGSRNWIRPDPSTRDVGVAHTGDQRILYNGNKAIQVWEDTAQDFLEIYSENHILELIAQNSLFQGTLRKTQALGSEAFNNAWLTRHNPSPANKGHYWTFQQVMHIRSTPSTAADPLQPNEIEPLAAMPAIRPMQVTVTDTSDATRSSRHIVFSNGPAMQAATLTVALGFSDATMDWNGTVNIKRGESAGTAANELITALRANTNGLTISSPAAGEVNVTILKTTATITAATLTLGDTGSRAAGPSPFNGRDIKVGDWIQSLGDQSQGMNGWTIISGDLVTKSRGDNLYGMSAWQPGSTYEQGALVNYGGRLWRATKNFNGGDADALAAPGTLGTTAAYPGGLQDLGQMGWDMGGQVNLNDQASFNSNLPLPNPDNRGWWAGPLAMPITVQYAQPGLPLNTQIAAGSFIYSDGIRWQIIPPGAADWPPNPPTPTTVNFPPIPVLPNAPWRQVPLQADIRMINYSALPATDASGQPWMVLGDPRMNGVPSIQRFDQASQSWQVVNSGQLPLDPTATTQLTAPAVAEVAVTPPANPSNGSLWVHPDTLKLYCWIGTYTTGANTWAGNWVELN